MNPREEAQAERSTKGDDGSRAAGLMQAHKYAEQTGGGGEERKQTRHVALTCSHQRAHAAAAARMRSPLHRSCECARGASPSSPFPFPLLATCPH